VADIKQFVAHMKPSLMMKRMCAHQGNLSEGDKAQILAERVVLGKRVTFLKDGNHYINGKIDLTEEEMFNSELLRFAHASILINQEVGDKKKLWVDASVNPVIVWLYGVPIEKFVHQAKLAINQGHIEPGFILDQHPEHFERETNYVRNVRLFGRHSDRSSVQDCNVRQAYRSGNSTVHYDSY
jgi:hypothetical protein